MSGFAMSEPATLPEHSLPPVEMALATNVPLSSSAMRDVAMQRAAIVELEHRIARLENAVADLNAAQAQDTEALENRVARKVMARLQVKAKDAERAEYVTAVTPRPTSHAHDDESTAPTHTTTGRQPWLLVDMIGSARLLWRMLFDPRHRLAWTTHVVVWVCLAAILLSAIWFPLAWIPFVGSYLDKVLDLLLAYFIYMALSRETRRYRETLAAG